MIFYIKREEWCSWCLLNTVVWYILMFSFAGLWDYVRRQGDTTLWRTETASGDRPGTGQKPQDPPARWGHVSLRHREWKGKVWSKNYLFTNFLLNFILILAKEVDLVFGPKFFFSLNLNWMNCKYICKEFYFLSN